MCVYGVFVTPTALGSIQCWVLSISHFSRGRISFCIAIGYFKKIFKCLVNTSWLVQGISHEVSHSEEQSLKQKHKLLCLTF